MRPLIGRSVMGLAAAALAVGGPATTAQAAAATSGAPTVTDVYV
ncbi:hypothetical protein ABZ835_45440 [Streptomyces sp. NPDC047461]